MVLVPPPSFPSRLVIGRSRGEAAAERRKDELNGYVWHLVHTAQDVAQVSWMTGRIGHAGSFERGVKKAKGGTN